MVVYEANTKKKQKQIVKRQINANLYQSNRVYFFSNRWKIISKTTEQSYWSLENDFFKSWQFCSKMRKKHAKNFSLILDQAHGDGVINTEI